MKLTKIKWKEEQSTGDLPHRWEGFIDDLHLFTYYQNEADDWFVKALFPTGEYLSTQKCCMALDCRTQAIVMLVAFVAVVTGEEIK